MVNYEKISGIIEHSKFHLISYIAKNSNFSFPAIYLIYGPLLNLQYIGQTNCLHSRMEEHLCNIGYGNLCSKVKRRPQMSQRIEQYRVKYIKIENFRERCFSEACLLGIYEPPLNFTR